MAAFPQFEQFPNEVQTLILQACPPNDRTCLRLSSKHMFHLLPGSHDSTPTTGAKTSLPGLTDVGSDPLCCSRHCDAHGDIDQREICHVLSQNRFYAGKSEARAAANKRKRCTSQFVTEDGSWHCSCFLSPLYRQLKSWMPSDTRFCRTCEKFTVRKPWHNGRCYHGRPKPRKRRSLAMTHRRGRGGFGLIRDPWKVGYRNSSMEKYEQRLRNGQKALQRGSESWRDWRWQMVHPGAVVTKLAVRYNLRDLKPRPEINTRKERNHRASEEDEVRQC